MLKIKKPIPFNLSTFDEEEYNKNQNEIKNSIKKLYVGNQNKKKTIDEYAQLVKYAKLQNKIVQQEKTLQKYKDYIENWWSKIERNNRYYRKPIRKTKIPYYRHDNEIENEGYLTGDENEEEDENEYYTRQGISKPKRKKRIVYIDEIDGNDDDNEEIEEEEEEPEVVTKVKKVTPKKKIKKDVKKVGIMKSI